MEQNINNTQTENGKEQEIDLLELVGKLWRKKKQICKAAGYGALIGLVVAFSLPREYTVSVTLSPESGKAEGSSLMGMASMLGLGNATIADADALNVSLFPEIIASTPFALELYSMQVKPEKSDTTVALHQFVEEQSKPWWGYVFALPGKAIGGVMSLFSDKEEEERIAPDPFHLTRKEEKSLMLIKESMKAEADKTTGITTITVTLQDPVVTAVVADSVVNKLQQYIADYRTRKATEDFNYQEVIYNKAKAEFYSLQQEYARYVDRNQKITLQSAKIEQERMKDQYDLAYQLFQQAATQLEVFRAKIQEDKPVFAVIEPASVPLKPSAPRKVIILIGFVFLAVVGSGAWILFGKELWEDVKKGIRG